MATSTGPWDETDDSASYDQPTLRAPKRSTLRTSHLRDTYPHAIPPVQHTNRASLSQSRMGGVVADKVEDLAASLHATTEVLSTADRMLEHYRDINVEQDEEIAKLRAELEKSANILKRERISRRRRLPATPPSSQSEDEYGTSRKRGPVTFHEDVQSEVNDLRHAVRNLRNEQSRLTGEMERERGRHSRVGDVRPDARGLMGTTDVTSLDDLAERERLLKELRETEEASRRQAEVLVKGLDAERDVLRESQRLATERDRELESLRRQLQANQKSQQDEIENRLKQIQEEMRAERETWERKQQQVGELASELRNVRSLLDEANEKKVRDEIRSVASELENERRALEKSEHEKRVLVSRVEDLAGRLDQAERERREVMAELEATAKRLDQSEGGKSALADQAEQLRQQFARADIERTELNKRLEDAQARLEENESSRKRLQSRLEGLSRQLEEGQGDRERLVEQLESLRGQAAKAEREKEDIMQHVARLTRGVTQRGQSFGPSLRRSLGRTERSGSDHVSELRRNLDRSELERDLDRRNHVRMDTGDHFYEGLPGRNFQREDMDRQDLVNNLELLHHDMDRRDEQQERLLSQMRDLLAKYEESEEQKKRFMTELETVTKKLKEATNEVEGLNEQLEERENQLKESDKKRSELKNKALQSIKEYRTKCKRLEREAEQGHEAMLRSEKLERELRELRSMASSGGAHAGSFIGTSRREIDGLMDQRHRLNDELASKNAEIRELQAVRYNAERDVSDIKKAMEKLEGELREQQAHLSAANLEKMKLEEALQAAKMNRKQDDERQEASQRKQEEERAELELTVAEHKREIKDLRTKVAKLVSKLQQETAQQQEYEERIMDAREQERSAKDEAASLYSQLQQERDAHTNALRELEEQIQSLTANHEQTLQEATKKSSKQKSDMERQIADMKIQLADEKSTIKALRKRQEKDREEIEKLNTDVNVATEESNKLKTRYEQVKDENDSLKEKVEVNQSRIAQIEDSLRRSQYALEKAVEEQQSGLQKVDDQLDRIVEQVDDQLDRIVEQVCRDTDTPLPSLLASGGSIRNNSQHWIADMIGKFRWLSEVLKARLLTERRLKEQADWSQKRIREVVQKADEDKEYFISELDKQSMLLDELAAQKKGLESKNKQNTDNIKALQDRISQLTAHLETSTRALHATAEALDDRQKVFDEFEGLRGEQKERDKLHDKYVRYKERVGSIRRELQGAKSIAEDYRQESLDARNLSSTLLESLDRISSPKAKQRRLHRFPDTPPTNMRPSVSRTDPVTDWLHSPESLMSTVSEDPTPLSSPLKERKRSHKIQDYRVKGPMAVTDLDYKER